MKTINAISVVVLISFFTLVAYGIYTQCDGLASGIYVQCKAIGNREVIVWVLVLIVAVIWPCKGTRAKKTEDNEHA